jgi:hypothetical protein
VARTHNARDREDYLRKQPRQSTRARRDHVQGLGPPVSFLSRQATRSRCLYTCRLVSLTGELAQPTSVLSSASRTASSVQLWMSYAHSVWTSSTAVCSSKQCIIFCLASNATTFANYKDLCKSSAPTPKLSTSSAASWPETR